MNVLIVLESCYGNTAKIAEAIAAGLSGAGAVVTTSPAAQAPEVGDADLVLVGAPTHNRALPSPASRRQAAQRRPQAGVTADAAGVREWLQEARFGTAKVATFDTRLAAFMSGSAAKSAGKLLRRRKINPVSSCSFLVTSGQSVLVDGEYDRARRWGADLAE